MEMVVKSDRFQSTISLANRIRSRLQSPEVPPGERVPGIDAERPQIRRFGIAEAALLLVGVPEVVPCPRLPRGFPRRVLPHGDLAAVHLSLIHISEPTRLGMISYAVFCLKK